MKLEGFIAGRYLFAKKSHNVINVISAISAAGMAIGTAALILILSVYNGFDNLIRENLSDVDPDVKVIPAVGKYFDESDALYDLLLADDCVESCCMVLEDNVFLSYGNRQGVAKAKGVDAEYERVSGLERHFVEGEFSLRHGDVRQAALGSTLAYGLGAHPRFLDPLVIYYPDRSSGISLINPEASLHSEKVYPSGIFSITSTVDGELMIVPLETMRALVGGDDTATAAELRLRSGAPRRYAARLADRLGPDYKVMDRYQQHPSLYRMMKYEKLAIFLILIFVVIIIAFNIFGSLSMLVIEKREDIGTLRAMGANGRLVRRVFVLEGWLISLLGLGIGTVVGVVLALLQQRFGFVKMPGGFLTESYPAALSAVDVLCVFAGVAAVGLVIAVLAAPSASGSDNEKND